MGLTINHNTRHLQAVRGDELGRYIDGCMTMAYAEARNSYRAELHAGLEAMAERQERDRIPLRLPLPTQAPFVIGEARSPFMAERVEWVELTPDQIRAVSHFLTGIRP